MNIKILFLTCLLYGESDAFLTNPKRQFRKLQLKTSFLLKKNNTFIDSYTKDRVIENMSTIVKDDLSNIHENQRLIKEKYNWERKQKDYLELFKD